MFSTILSETKALLRRAASISLALYKIMVPIIIVVKILQELQLIALLARPLAPVMQLVGLPAEMGLVWGTAMLNNIYSGMIVFVSIMGQHPLSVAQVTVLCTMMLLAHALPIELQIVAKSGPRIVFQGLLRIIGALILGVILHKIYDWGGWLQQANVVLWEPGPQNVTILQWTVDQLRNLGMIFVIIFCLTLFMRLLTVIGLTDLCVRLLAPVLRLLGIGPEAGTLTIIGMVMGLSYGGGMIMHEVKSGTVPERDVFASLSLMGLSHSVFEDTLLMAVLGGHASGLLWARVIFTLIVIALLVRVVTRLGDDFFHRHLYRTVISFAPPRPCCPGAMVPESSEARQQSS